MKENAKKNRLGLFSSAFLSLPSRFDSPFTCGNYAWSIFCCPSNSRQCYFGNRFCDFHFDDFQSSQTSKNGCKARLLLGSATKMR